MSKGPYRAGEEAGPRSVPIALSEYHPTSLKLMLPIGLGVSPSIAASPFSPFIPRSYGAVNVISIILTPVLFQGENTTSVPVARRLDGYMDFGYIKGSLTHN